MCNAPRKFFIPLSVELDIVGIFSLFWPMDNGLLEASKKFRCKCRAAWLEDTCYQNVK